MSYLVIGVFFCDDALFSVDVVMRRGKCIARGRFSAVSTLGIHDNSIMFVLHGWVQLLTEIDGGTIITVGSAINFS